MKNFAKELEAAGGVAARASLSTIAWTRQIRQDNCADMPGKCAFRKAYVEAYIASIQWIETVRRMVFSFDANKEKDNAKSFWNRAMQGDGVSADELESEWSLIRKNTRTSCALGMDPVRLMSLLS